MKTKYVRGKDAGKFKISKTGKKVEVFETGGLLPFTDPFQVEKNKNHLQKLRTRYGDLSFVDRVLRSCADSLTGQEPLSSQIREIEDGNINLSFQVKTNVTDLFVKKYLPYVRANPQLKVIPFSGSLATKEARIINFLQEITPPDSRVRVPPLIGYSEKEGVLVTKFLEGYRPLFIGPHDTLVPVCGDIGSFLRYVHGVESIPGIEIKERIQGTFERITLRHSNRVRNIPLSDKIREWIDEHSTVKKTLIHGDFSPKNLLWDGKNVFLIDFQDVMYGDRSRDVGQFLGDLISTGIKRNLSTRTLERAWGAFWKNYAGESLPEAESILRRSKTMAGMVLIYRSLGLYDYGSTEDTKRFGQKCYKTGLRLILTDEPLSRTLAKIK
ncbi:Methylthioribose kinase [Candidatus Norongarragalina meridionalis]|nr:Methylthioribose kinase [Candidatus Norongarragalina meridionalis]